MNEVLELRLLDFMDSPDGWGHEQGREVYGRLLSEIEAHPESHIVRLSLAGVRRTDASFPRESVVELARRYRGNKGFCLVDVANEDLLDNWDAAAAKRGQTLIVWDDASYRLVGTPPSRGNESILALVMDEGQTTAGGAAKRLAKTSLQNASTKLKQLSDQGLILRRSTTSPTGGVEYVYTRIR